MAVFSLIISESGIEIMPLEEIAVKKLPLSKRNQHKSKRKLNKITAWLPATRKNKLFLKADFLLIAASNFRIITTLAIPG